MCVVKQWLDLRFPPFRKHVRLLKAKGPSLGWCSRLSFVASVLYLLFNTHFMHGYTLIT